MVIKRRKTVRKGDRKEIGIDKRGKKRSGE